MFCPILENEITENKKRSEWARKYLRTGYCYIEVQDRYNKFLISEIKEMTLKEYKEWEWSLSKSKKYRTVNGFWSDIMKVSMAQYEEDIEFDNPTIIEGI